MNISDFNTGLRAFLAQSPTPYHAVEVARQKLEQAGFTRLHERDEWQLKPGGRYYVTRHDSSLLAFVYGDAPLTQNGLRMIGAHTDSPCLKLKPNPERVAHGYFQLGVEVYGGALLYPWFDRDLSLAGRVSLRRGQELIHRLIDFKRPVAVIPNLAIHLDREANNGRAVNAQEEMRAILLQTEGDNPTIRDLLKTELLNQQLIRSEDEILEFDLSFYDTQAPAEIGLQDDFLASARLDNLLSCYLGLEVIQAASQDQASLLILNDHEEVGSVSDVGAQGNLLSGFIERLLPDASERQRTMDASMMYSVDNAHGIHPNFARKHDESHGPILNQGPVLKINANQRYATTSDGASLTRLLADQAQVPLQVFVTRADMACGSTIGPMTAAKMGLKTVDIGVPTFAMHSIRELAGQRDAHHLYRLLHAFTARSELL
jgi:aspartyl aminopeptidase